MDPCDREGTYRVGEVLNYGLKKFEGSTSVAVALHVRLVELLHEGEWYPVDQECYGDVWILKKNNGGPNQKSVESLIEHAGWDGNLESIANGTWKPTPFQVTTKADEYQGNVSYKINFVNAWDAKPRGAGSLGTASADDAKQLQNQWGSQLRALAGNRMRPQPPAASKPATPPRPAAKPQSVPAGAAPADDGIPF